MIEPKPTTSPHSFAMTSLSLCFVLRWVAAYIFDEYKENKKNWGSKRELKISFSVFLHLTIVSFFSFSRYTSWTSHPFPILCTSNKTNMASPAFSERQKHAVVNGRALFVGILYV